MPLPMPYSSICSPSHIRNTVPAVMVMTAAKPNQHRLKPSAYPAAARPIPPAVGVSGRITVCTKMSACTMQIGTVS